MLFASNLAAVAKTLLCSPFIKLPLLTAGVLHALLGIWKVAGEDKRSHLMSDHMLLGASLTAILATEIGLGLLDLKRALEQKRIEAFRIFSVLSGKRPLLDCSSMDCKPFPFHCFKLQEVVPTAL